MRSTTTDAARAELVAAIKGGHDPAALRREAQRQEKLQGDLDLLERCQEDYGHDLGIAIASVRREMASPPPPAATSTKRWVKAAIEHWMPLLDECHDIGCDWAEAHNHCWRCGCERRLQRCHMVPKALGGTLEPGNVMPLCADCHAEAPDTDNPADFLAWIKETRNLGQYDSYWAKRCWREAQLPLPHNQEHTDAVLLEWTCLIVNSAGSHRTHMATSTKVALLKRAHASVPDPA